MRYMLFYTGLASTPDTVGLKNVTTGEVIHEVSVSRPSGVETRKQYNKVVNLLKTKYSPILN